jgi:hypothetical protein
MNPALFLQTIVLCLSVPIRGYDDPNFGLPSAGLSLHLQSCEIASASLWALVKHGTSRKSIPPELLNKSQDGCMEQLQSLDLSPMSAVGAALLRIILAGLWIVHWWFKVGYRRTPATEAFFLQHGQTEIVKQVCNGFGTNSVAT